MKKKKTRSLRFVSVIIILVAFVFCEAIIIGLFSTNMTSMLRQAEEHHLEEMNGTINASMREMALTLRENTRAWSSRDDTYNFVLGDFPEFIAENLEDGAMLSLNNADYVIIIDKEGNNLFQGASDIIINDNKKEKSLTELSQQQLTDLVPDGLSNHLVSISNDVIANHVTATSPTAEGPNSDTGFITYNDISYMNCTMPIIPSDEESEPVGTFTYLIKFDEERFSSLTGMKVTDFSIVELEKGSDEEGALYAESTKKMTISTIIENLGSDRRALMQYSHERLIYSSGITLIITTIIILTIGLLIAFLFFFFMANKFVIKAFRVLLSDISNVEKKEQVDSEKHTSFSEIQEVSVAINDMVNRLDQSYQAEQQSQVSLNILTNLLNGLDAYLYVSDPIDDKILFINDKMKDHFGLKGVVVGETCWKVLQEGYTERCEFCPSHTLKEPGDVMVWEEKNSVTNRYYRNTDTLIEWSENYIVHLQHSVDITDIKAAEIELQHKFEQQKIFTEISQSFISTQDADSLIDDSLRKIGEFMRMEAVFVVQLLSDKEAIVSHEWEASATSPRENRRIFSAEDIQKIKAMLAGTDYQISKSEGYELTIDQIEEALWVPILLNRNLWGALFFGKSDSGWSENEIHVAGLIASLLSGLIGRNEMEREIVEAKELAEEGSRSKGEFLSRMSHEMRTPMNAIIGMTDIAKNADNPEKKEYCLDKIDNASKHLLGVINDILDMSKIEANKFELSYTEFNLDNIIMNVLNVIIFRVEEKHQELKLFIQPNIPTILWGDAQRLAQVITNLLTNAVKFTPEKGKIGLNVRLISENEDGITLQFEVTDTGIGISDEQQKKLFTSFEQADGSISRKFGGTGLGLAISKRIVEMMNGKIWIESEEGKGSSFKFDVEVKPVKENKIEKTKMSISKSELKVLVVDDARETCDYFVEIMSTLEIDCEVALSGDAALSMIQEEGKSYDMVFVDWKMPGMDGLELAQELRDNETKNQVIIMISAAAWSEMENEAKKIGVDGYIPKPLYPSALIECIGRFINFTNDSSNPQNLPVYSFPGKMALLAEDIEINREIVSTILADTGLEVECAENGVEAVEMFSKNPDRYDIIFMDMQMPEMDGLEATRRIRALENEHSKLIPIIAMTANVFREDVVQCLEAGMNEHIGKPIDFDDLFEMLNKYFNAM